MKGMRVCVRMQVSERHILNLQRLVVPRSSLNATEGTDRQHRQFVDFVKEHPLEYRCMQDDQRILLEALRVSHPRAGRLQAGEGCRLPSPHNERPRHCLCNCAGERGMLQLLTCAFGSTAPLGSIAADASACIAASGF